MQTILIVTSSERASRILLRGLFFEELKKRYKIIVSSMAENSKKWKESIQGVEFFSDGKGISIKDKLKEFDIKAVIGCGNTDTPINQFDLLIQTEAKILNIPFINIQDFIDAIFHPLMIKPDKYLVWGNFFKTTFSEKRDVLLWDKTICAVGQYGTVDALESEIIEVCGAIHFDDYKLRNIPTKIELCRELEFDPNKLIFSYVPNGEYAEWVFWTFDNFMQSARKFNAQVILKLHPIRHNDSWIFNFIISKYPEVPVRVLRNWSFGKGWAGNMAGYANGEFFLDHRDSLQLAGILKNSDIVGSMGSTASVESLIFDVPTVIDTSFWSHPWPIREQVMRWFWSVLYKYNCCDIVTEKNHLENVIELNLLKPERKTIGRKSIVQDFFNNVDGKAHNRAVDSIEKFLEKDV